MSAQTIAFRTLNLVLPAVHSLSQAAGVPKEEKTFPSTHCSRCVPECALHRSEVVLCLDHLHSASRREGREGTESNSTRSKVAGDEIASFGVPRLS